MRHEASVREQKPDTNDHWIIRLDKPASNPDTCQTRTEFTRFRNVCNREGTAAPRVDEVAPRSTMRPDIDVTAAHSTSEAQPPSGMDSVRGALGTERTLRPPGADAAVGERPFQYLIWENAP